MSNEYLIFGMIPVSQYPTIKVSEKVIRDVLEQYNLPHSHIEIFEDLDKKATMWVDPVKDCNRTISYNKMGYNSRYLISKSMILHEYGHIVHNMKILNSIYRGKISCNTSTFLANAEYYADTFCLDTLYKNRDFETLKIHLMQMLFYGVPKNHKDPNGYNGEHSIAATRIFRKKNFKRYKKYLDPLHIIQRQYYKPTVIC